MEKKKVWFVTGASKGLGLALVKKLLANGYQVAATSRDIKSLAIAVGNTTNNFLPLQMDLVNEESVNLAINNAIHTFDKIDVAVNNAGYGQLGTLEELSDQEARKNFDANVFGTLNMIRNIMPHLREQKSGHIINIASIGGYTGGFPGWGIYCATKFAVAGFTEGLAEEIKEFGLNATVVYPGYFRTGFLSGNSLQTPANEIKAYSAARQVQMLHQDQIDGSQSGDPDKAATALINISEMEIPPVHLFLGSDAYQFANDKMQIIKTALEQTESITKSTNF